MTSAKSVCGVSRFWGLWLALSVLSTSAVAAPPSSSAPDEQVDVAEKADAGQDADQDDDEDGEIDNDADDVAECNEQDEECNDDDETDEADVPDATDRRLRQLKARAKAATPKPDALERNRWTAAWTSGTVAGCATPVVAAAIALTTVSCSGLPVLAFGRPSGTPLGPTGVAVPSAYVGLVGGLATFLVVPGAAGVAALLLGHAPGAHVDVFLLKALLGAGVVAAVGTAAFATALMVASLAGAALLTGMVVASVPFALALVTAPLLTTAWAVASLPLSPDDEGDASDTPVPQMPVQLQTRSLLPQLPAPQRRAAMRF